MADDVILKDAENSLSEAAGTRADGEVTAAPGIERKQYFSVGRREAVMSAATFAFCVLLVFEGIWGGFRVGFTVGCSFVLAALGVHLRRGGPAPDGYARFCGAAAFALSAVFAVTSDPAVRFFSAAVMACVSAVWLMGLAGKKVPQGDMGTVRTILGAVGIALGNIPKSVSSLLNAGGKKTGPVLKGALGILCAVPVLLIVVPLLMRSDAAFEGMVSGFLEQFEDIRILILQTLLTVMIWMAAVSFGLSARSHTDRPRASEGIKGADTAFLGAFVSLLSACYLCYLFSQLAYFFSAFSGMLPEEYDFSYAEYARRGFFEIAVISGINAAVIFALIVLSRKKEGTIPAFLKAAGSFICCFTIVLITTALSKMVMYIKVYGMTLLRVETGLFMIFLAAVFVTMTARLFTPKVKVLKFALAAAACALIILGIGNAASFTARYNYSAYSGGRLETVDTDHMRELGDEGVPYLVKLAGDEKTSVRRSARRNLYYAFEEYYELNGYYSLERVAGNRDTLPERKYSRLSQFGFCRGAAYRAMEEFLLLEPEFLIQNIRLHYGYDPME